MKGGVESGKGVLAPVYIKKVMYTVVITMIRVHPITYSMKLRGRIMESKLREDIIIGEHFHSFIPGKNTLRLRLLLEKYREGQKELIIASVDLENGLWDTKLLDEGNWSGWEVSEDGVGIAWIRNGKMS